MPVTNTPKARGSYVPDKKKQLSIRRRLPARCNRRDCQARRTLTKHPELYVRWPRCHACGIGKMYVDWYRVNRGPYDHAPHCRDAACQYNEKRIKSGKKPIPYHRVSLKECIGYVDWTLERSAAASKHSPFSLCHDEEAPF